MRDPRSPPASIESAAVLMTTAVGARRKTDLDEAFINLLEAGVVESRTHIEQMAIKMSRLLGNAFPDLEFDADAVDETPFIRRLRLIGTRLYEAYGSAVRDGASSWISDTVRGWLAMSACADTHVQLEDQLTQLIPFMRDHHFAVREWAWLAARPAVVVEGSAALPALVRFLQSPDPNDRRFAIELTRPRSVWGAHIAEFKSNPEAMEPAIHAFRCEMDPYVQRAMGNWLNDASKSRPDWVQRLATEWTNECTCNATARIVSRGTRSLIRL